MCTQTCRWSENQKYYDQCLDHLSLYVYNALPSLKPLPVYNDHIIFYNTSLSVYYVYNIILVF